jgi:hypothetical protein
MLGEEVKTLVDENQNAVFKSVEWNASEMRVEYAFII